MYVSQTKRALEKTEHLCSDHIMLTSMQRETNVLKLLQFPANENSQKHLNIIKFYDHMKGIVPAKFSRKRTLVYTQPQTLRHGRL